MSFSDRLYCVQLSIVCLSVSKLIFSRLWGAYNPNTFKTWLVFTWLLNIGKCYSVARLASLHASSNKREVTSKIKSPLVAALIGCYLS